MINCTIAANVADDAGGIWNFNGMSLINCTVSGNVGGGIYAETDVIPGTPPTVLANTIAAGNILKSQAYFNGTDVLGAIVSHGNNLIGQTDGSTGWIAADLTGSVAHPLASKLGPLANNGGPTQTFVPLAGSPAIAHGSVQQVPAGIVTDQRGRPRIVAGKVDIGSVEIGGVTLAYLKAPAATQNVIAGKAVSLQLGTIVSPGAADGPYAVTVNWGDGAPAAHFVVNAAGAFTAPAHVFRYAGNYAPSSARPIGSATR